MAKIMLYNKLHNKTQCLERAIISANELAWLCGSSGLSYLSAGVAGRFSSAPCIPHPALGTSGLAWTCPSHGSSKGQEQTGQSWNIFMPLLVSLLLASRWPNQVTWLPTELEGTLQSHMMWHSEEVNYRCHFYKLSKETVTKMMINAVLDLIGWYWETK